MSTGEMPRMSPLAFFKAIRYDPHFGAKSGMNSPLMNQGGVYDYLCIQEIAWLLVYTSNRRPIPWWFPFLDPRIQKCLEPVRLSWVSTTRITTNSPRPPYDGQISSVLVCRSYEGKLTGTDVISPSESVSKSLTNCLTWSSVGQVFWVTSFIFLPLFPFFFVSLPLWRLSKEGSCVCVCETSRCILERPEGTYTIETTFDIREKMSREGLERGDVYFQQNKKGEGQGKDGVTSKLWWVQKQMKD